MFMRFSIITFGCKLNQAESQILKDKLINKGFTVVPENKATDLPASLASLKRERSGPVGGSAVACRAKVDFFVINACAVTAKAEKELRQKINQIKRSCPKSKIVVTGCYLPQKNDKVDLWVSKKQSINKICTFIKKIKYSDSKVRNLTSRRTRAFIKIQDGCDNFCTYCIVPFLRGKPKNRSINNIVREIKKKEKDNCQEIVLVGTDLRKFSAGGGSSSGGKSLVDLLKIILEKTSIPRVRLSSFWPTAITKNLINLAKKESRICPHFHLSIQSGCDKILKRMGRDYRSHEVIKLIRKLKSIRNINLAADIIVGFPDETEEDFRETLNFVKKAKFLKIHVFKYSARPGTAAAAMSEQLEEMTKKTRSRKLIQLAQKISNQTKKNYLGQVFPVLFENKKNNLWSGLAHNYLKIYVKSQKFLTNKIINVKLLRLYKDGIYAKIT